MYCVGIKTILFFILFAASALEPGIDLLEALNLHNNHSQYIGVSLTQGFAMKLAYRLSKFIYNFTFKKKF